MHNCNKEREIDGVRDDVREIRKDVKTLLQSVSGLKVKSGMWGAIGGCVPLLSGLIIYLLTRGTK